MYYSCIFCRQKNIRRKGFYVIYKRRKRSSFYYLMKHDIAEGILHQWWKYTPFLIISVYSCLSYYLKLMNNPRLNALGLRPTFGDYIFDMYKGMEIFKVKSPTDIFDIPATFLLINLYLAYLIIKYPFNDLSQFGKYILIRSGSKKNWWVCKCIWSVINVVIVYGIAILTSFAFSLFTGDISLRVTQVFNGIKIDNFDTNTLILTAILLPFFTSVVISVIELLISLFTKTMYGMMTAICIIAASAYYCSAYLVGNYLMILRSDCIIPLEGVSIKSGLIINGAIFVLCFVTGILKLKKYDIMN